MKQLKSKRIVVGITMITLLVASMWAVNLTSVQAAPPSAPPMCAKLSTKGVSKPIVT